MNREDVAIPPARCPACGYKMDSATSPAKPDARPTQGDFTICLSCGVCLVFGKRLKLRPATVADVRGAPPELQRELATVTRAVLQLRQQRRQS